MTGWPMRLALAVASLAVAVTAPSHWMAILFGFLSGLFASAALYGRIIDKAVDHEPY
jgi:hypothetical protein